LPCRSTATTARSPTRCKAGTSYGGKALVTSFTGSPAQLPLSRLMLKAYAETHGYSFDESGEGAGRPFDELTSQPGAPKMVSRSTFTCRSSSSKDIRCRSRARGADSGWRRPGTFRAA
jgi:hypothetical protein